MVNFLFKKYNKRIKHVLFLVMFLLMAWFLFFGHKYQFVYNHGISMEPTIQDKEWLVVQKRSNLGEGWVPERFDLVIIEDEKDNEDLVKRVIGLPGETVKIEKGQIYINDLLFKGPYGEGKMSFYLVDENDKNLKYWNGPNAGESVVRLLNQQKKTIPKDSVWVIGDNREESWYGILPIKNIKSLVIF